MGWLTDWFKRKPADGKIVLMNSTASTAALLISPSITKTSTFQNISPGGSIESSGQPGVVTALGTRSLLTPYDPLPAVVTKYPDSNTTVTYYLVAAAGQLTISTTPPTPKPGPTPTPIPFPVPSGVTLLAHDAALLEAHNKMRAKIGRSPLVINAQLNLAAAKHAVWMANNGIMSHTGEGRSSMSGRIKAAGYSFSSAGENVAMGATTVDSVMTMWRNSPGHYSNIVGGYREVGFGAASKSGRIYWAVDFGTPR